MSEVIDLTTVPTLELQKELTRRQRIENIEKHKSFKLKGVGVKDIVMVYGYPYGEDQMPQFAPHYKTPKGRLKFCYFHPKIDYNDWGLFLPGGFCEVCETIYEFVGDLETALKYLDEIGMEYKRDDAFFEG